ncbi:MAG: hypothetical protein LBJ17_05515 [Dysgonamonadaceae bacterium]|nr:hypothetical protein [Dysgonamonadaceae bacterium]
MSTQDWMPRSHELRHKLAVLIFTILIGDLRIKAGLTAKTPPGDWYDTVYTPQCTIFCTAFDVWNDISTRTPVALDDLDKAEEDFIPLVRKLHSFVSGNPVITDSDLEKMGFPKHSSGGHAPSPVAEHAPFIRARADEARTVGFHYGASESSRSKPEGQHGIEVISTISDAVPVLKDLTRSDFDTRTPLKLTFADEDRGKKLWFAARWENTRGQKGPFGEIQSVIIP